MSFADQLKAARAMAGLSLSELVERLDHAVSKAALGKYEQGLMLPGSAVVVKLAAVLALPVDYFYREKTVVLGDVRFRKRSALGVKRQAAVLETVRDKLERYLEIEAILADAPVFVVPDEIGPVADEAAAMNAANTLRQAWGLGAAGGVPGCIALLEAHGVKVIEIAGDPGFDGAANIVSGVPFIALNATFPNDRKRLTAMHELAHLVLRLDDDRESERLCYAFAAAFLLPPTLLERELGRRRAHIDIDELVLLKKKYGLSVQAIMRHALVLGIIDDAHYQRFCRQVSAHHWRVDEPGIYPIDEKADRFASLVRRALAEGIITASKAAALSGGCESLLPGS